MKCLILNSPIYRERSEETEEYLPPIGLGYITTHIKVSGINAMIVDCVKERLGVNQLFDLLRQQYPDVIGINIFTQNYDTVKEIIEKCPIKTTVIIGGQVVKCIYKEILQWNVPNKLILIIGEGELIIPAILNDTCSEFSICNQDNKSVYRVDKNSSYFPRDLNMIPLDRTLLNEDTVTNHYNEKESAIITSRGCMYNCAFCGGAHNLNQDVIIRYRSISNVEKEIYEIIRMHPEVTSIRVLDDLFLRDMTSIKNSIELFGKLANISWRAMAHILTFDKLFDMLPPLKQSGCRELFIGIESGSEIMRRKINKPGTSQQVVDVVTAILKAGIDVKGYFMYGFPDETVLDAEDTYALALLLRNISKTTKGVFRASVFQFRPYHGTQLYNEIVQNGRVVSTISSNMTLNIIKGRSQFNFCSGNYSKIADEKLNDFIIKTQRLSEEISYA